MYNNLSKSELWSLVKEQQASEQPSSADVHSAITNVTWRSTKQEMIDALKFSRSQFSRSHSVTQPQIEVVTTTGDFTLWDELTESIVTDTPSQNTDKESAAFVITRTPDTCDNLSVQQVRQQVSRVYWEIWNLFISDYRNWLWEQLPDNNKVYLWSYKDHTMTGVWKEVTDESHKQDIKGFVESFVFTLPPEKKFIVRGTISLRMKPAKYIAGEREDGKEILRNEKKGQQNNLYANRRKTLMSTTETAGRNVGQPSVKESILFKAAQLVAQPIFKDGIYNYTGIETISINGKQVYPVAISTALVEEKPASDAQLNIKQLKRRKINAQQKVATKGYQHIRGKISNGLSPAFQDGNKLYCFQIDNNNRVRAWLLSNETGHTVSASDLLKGRLLCDLGFLEVKPFEVEIWKNLTLDMIQGGKEARLMTFRWITARINGLSSLEEIEYFLTHMKEKDNSKPLVVENLRITPTLISGRLYGSELLIKKGTQQKTTVVLHPTAKAPELMLSAARSWVFSLPSSVFDNGASLGTKVQSKISNKQRYSDLPEGAKSNRTKVGISIKDDVKYCTRMLTLFSKEIYADKEKTVKLGRLVLTDGTSLTEQQIERIAQRVVDNFPVNQKLATLFTPSHHHPDEWGPMFLKLLKQYAQVELCILQYGKLIHWNNGEQLLTDWCLSVTRYLRGMNKPVEVLSIGDAIEMLRNSPASSQKTILLDVPTIVSLHQDDQLTKALLTPKSPLPVKKLGKIGEVKAPYADLVAEVRKQNGLD